MMSCLCTRRQHSGQCLLVHDVMEADDLDPNYDINTGINTVLANAVACSSSGTRIPTLQWFEFSSEVKELWQSLSETDRAIILGASSKSCQCPMAQMSKASSGVQHPFGLGTNTKKLSSYFLEITMASGSLLDHGTNGGIGLLPG
jgi:hypothetical protein